MQLSGLRGACLTWGLWRAAELLAGLPDMEVCGVGIARVQRGVEAAPTIRSSGSGSPVSIEPLPGR